MAAYTPWANSMPPDIELGIVRLPGRDDRMKEAPYTSLAELVPPLADSLSPWLDLPFACYGHSMGALIAYELLRYLQSRREPGPVHLFVAARRAPHLENHEAPCHDLPRAAFLAEIIRRYNGFPEAILAEPELLERLLPILRADMKLLETYRHAAGEPLDTPITAFGGSEDNRVSREDLAAWQDLTGRQCRVYFVPGGHFFLRSAQSELLRIIAERLADGNRSEAVPKA